jgi:hypothetical protein
MNFNFLEKPPPEGDNNGWNRWFYKVCQILNDIASVMPSLDTLMPVPYPTPITFGTNADNVTIEADGTITLNGTATVWEDLNFSPNNSGGPAVTIPDYVTINNVVHREFTSANNQLCGSSQELPHHYKLSSQIYPHAHIYWELRQGAGTTSGSVVLSATSAELTGNGHKINVSDVTGFAGAAELGAQLTVKIARTGGNAGDVIVTTYGVHYERDSNGSKQMTTK